MNSDRLQKLTKPQVSTDAMTTPLASQDGCRKHQGPSITNIRKHWLSSWRPLCVSRVGSAVISEAKQLQASPLSSGLWSALVTLGLRRFPFVHYSASASATICPLTACPLAPHVCLFLPLFMRCYSELHSIGTTTCWTSSLLYNSLQIAVTRNEIPPLSPFPLPVLLPNP